jgi:hypothetical protein
MAASDVTDDALEGYLQRAGKWAKMRRSGRVSRGFVVHEAHDIVGVGAVVKSSHP